MQKAKIQQLLDYFNTKYPDPKPPLHSTNGFSFLVAVILSAQCTDERVNQVTPSLFPKYDSPEKLVALGQARLAEIIKPCGFFNTKSKNIIQMAETLISKHNSQLPRQMDDLVALPGVGRKTASVILSQLFDRPAFAVDTHVFRVCNRLGLTDSKNPLQTERQVCRQIDKNYWNKLHLQLIFHGRELCKARKPLCYKCKLYEICAFQDKEKYYKQ